MSRTQDPDEFERTWKTARTYGPRTPAREPTVGDRAGGQTDDLYALWHTLPDEELKNLEKGESTTLRPQHASFATVLKEAIGEINRLVEVAADELESNDSDECTG